MVEEEWVDPQFETFNYDDTLQVQATSGACDSEACSGDGGGCSFND